MNILKLWCHKILFGYYYHPSAVYEEMENAGFSVRLFANGTLLWQTYSLDPKCLPVIRQSGRTALNGETISRITRVMAGYAKEIDALPEYTNNGSYDGSFNDFVFSCKFVSALNIQRTDPLAIMTDNPDYYGKYRFDMADENTVLDIFAKIIEVMQDDGVWLQLCHLKVGDKKIC